MGLFDSIRKHFRIGDTDSRVTKKETVIPVQPVASGAKPLTTGNPQHVYDSVRTHEALRLKHLLKIITLPEKQKNELISLMRNPAQEKLAGEKAFELWLTATLIGSDYRCESLEKWARHFESINYVPYMWDFEMLHSDDAASSNALHEMKKKLSSVSTPARAVIVGANAIKEAVSDTHKKISKRCGIPLKSLQAVICELRNKGFAKDPIPEERLKVISNNQLRELAKHFNLSATGTKNQLSQRLALVMDTDEGRKFLQKYVPDDVIVLGPIQADISDDTLKTEKARAKALLHYSTMSAHRENDTESSQLSKVVEGLEIQITDTDCPVCIEMAKKAESLPPFFPGCRCGVTHRLLKPSQWSMKKPGLKIFPPSTTNKY